MFCIRLWKHFVCFNETRSNLFYGQCVKSWSCSGVVGASVNLQTEVVYYIVKSCVFSYLS